MIETQKTEILNKVFAKFCQTTKLNIQIKQTFKAQQITNKFEIEIIAPDYIWSFDVLILEKVNEANIGLLVENLKKKKNQTIIVANLIPQYVAKKMKANGLQFMDTNGNIFLNKLPLYIDVIGQKVKTGVANRNKIKLFNPTGLRVIFGILCFPNIEKKTYRDIAAMTNVALGTVGWVFTELRKNDYLIELKNNYRKVINKKDLLEKWIVGYHDKLRKTQIRARYKTDETEWWKTIEIENYEARWGGEVGATYLNPYLKPANKTIYAQTNKINKLLAEKKMQLHNNGDIEILNQFWNFETNYKNIVHPVLIYADLIGTGDQRNIEMAQIIYEKEVLRYISED